MAAKKSTAKKSVKKAAPKKNTSKKVIKKTAAAKKNTISKKAVKKTVKATKKKVEAKAKPISASAKPKSNNWAIAAFIIAIVVLALVGVIGWKYFEVKEVAPEFKGIEQEINNVQEFVQINQENIVNKEQILSEIKLVNKELTNENVDLDSLEAKVDNIESLIKENSDSLEAKVEELNAIILDLNSQIAVANGKGVKLIIVEDPSCANCQVDLFADQVKANLIPELVIEKIAYDSNEGKVIVNELELKQVPAYFFSEAIDQRDDWETQLSGAFIEESLNGQKFYMLNPQFIPNKVMIEAPKVLEGSIIIGDENAPVTIAYFTDFECPFCAIAEGNDVLVEQFKVRSPDYIPPMPEVMKNYVETGKVKVVFYNNPIASLHPLIRSAHLAGLCANEQGKFVEFERLIWDNREKWSQEDERTSIWKDYAKELGLEQAKFDECLDTAKYDSQIEKEIALSQEYGVSGTPAFFVGKSFISGAQDYTTFKELIDSQLANE